MFPQYLLHSLKNESFKLISLLKSNFLHIQGEAKNLEKVAATIHFRCVPSVH